MITLRPFQSHGTAFQSTGSSTADAIPGTPMGASTLRIVNGSAGDANVALGDTAAEAVASLTTQYITVLAGSVEYLQIKNTQRFIASDTADLEFILGTGAGAGYGAGAGGGAGGGATAEEIDDALKATPQPVTMAGDSYNGVRVAVGTSSGVLIAARANRKSLSISNPYSNTATIAIDTGVAVLANHPNLEPGDSVTLATTVGFNAIGSAACSIDVIEVY